MVRLPAPLKNLLLAPLLTTTIILLGCSSPPSVKVSPVTKSSIESTVSSVTSGTVKAEREGVLAFGTVGRVERVGIELGDRVKAGEVLAEIESEDLVAAYETAQKEAQRVRSLVRSSTIASSETEQAQQMLMRAKAALEKSKIKAPFDGIIAELNLEEGQLSQVTTPDPKAMIRIVDLHPRYVEAEIDELDLRQVKVGQEARIKILAVRREPFRGTVRQVIPFVSTRREQDRTVLIELSVESEGKLLPAGASADVEVVTQFKSGVVSIPSRTVLGRGDNRFVYTAVKGVARRTPIKIGLTNYDRTEIIEGLSEGDLVIHPSDKLELSEGLSITTEGVAGESH